MNDLEAIAAEMQEHLPQFKLEIIDRHRPDAMNNLSLAHRYQIRIGVKVDADLYAKHLKVEHVAEVVFHDSKIHVVFHVSGRYLTTGEAIVTMDLPDPSFKFETLCKSVAEAYLGLKQAGEIPYDSSSLGGAYITNPHVKRLCDNANRKRGDAL